MNAPTAVTVAAPFEMDSDSMSIRPPVLIGPEHGHPIEKTPQMKAASSVERLRGLCLVDIRETEMKFESTCPFLRPIGKT